MGLCSSPTIICGDFNLHMDVFEHSDTKAFNEILASAGLVQLVSELTHVAGHWLDLIITNENSNCISDVHVVHTLPVLHFAIRFDVSLVRPPASRVQIRLRKIRQINTEEFRRDILSSNLTHPCDD